MYIKSKDKQPELNSLTNSIVTEFPELKIIKQTKNSVVFAASQTIGCTIILKKKKIILDAFFPTKKAQFIFYITVLIGGIVIPMSLYFILFHGKMKRVKKDIAAFIQSNS